MDTSTPNDKLSHIVRDLLSTPPHNVYYKLIEANVLLNDGDQQVLNAFGLTLSQLTALQLLDPVEGVRSVDLAEALLLDKSSVSRLLDRLVEARLVRRVTASTDRRSHRVIITQKGLALREQASMAHKHSLEKRLSTLDASQQQQLYALLDILCKQLHADLGVGNTASR